MRNHPGPGLRTANCQVHPVAPSRHLIWSDVRFLHHSLICSPLESLVPISTSFSTQALSRLRQLLLDRFFKILAVLDVGVRACTLCCSKLSWIFHPLGSLPFAVHHLTLQVPSVLECFAVLTTTIVPVSHPSDPVLGFSSSGDVVAVDCSKAVIYRYDQKYYRNNSARADFCRSLRQIIRALQNGAVQSKNNYAAIRYCNILSPVSLVTFFWVNTFFVQDLCLHIVDGVTRLSSSFERVAFTAQDLSPKKARIKSSPQKSERATTTPFKNGSRSSSIGLHIKS